MVDFEFREHYTIDDLRRIVAILRHPGGCPGTPSRPMKVCAAV